MKKSIIVVIVLILVAVLMVGCQGTLNQSQIDANNNIQVSNTLAKNQPTPTDIEYSLERYNLIRRAYWVNGQREKANMLVCEIEKPLGYVVLLTDSGSVVGRFVVDGKISSLNSFLAPDSEYYEGVSTWVWDIRDDGSTSATRSSVNKWLADVDGAYGANDEGIFFFNTQGNYIEWNALYLYSDIPFEVSDPVVKYEVVE